MKPKYMIGIITGCLCLLFLFLILFIGNRAHRSTEDKVVIAQNDNDSEDFAPPQRRSSPSFPIFQFVPPESQGTKENEVEETIEVSDEKQTDTQQLGVKERLETMKASEEYKELSAQNHALMEYNKELNSELRKFTRLHYSVAVQGGKIPSAPSKEDQEYFKKIESQLPQEFREWWKERVRIAKEKKSEREELLALEDELSHQIMELHEERRRLIDDFKQINSAISELYHQYDLPDNEKALKEAIAQEKMQRMK